MKSYLTNSGVLFSFKVKSEYILNTSDFTIVDDMLFRDDNELCIGMNINVLQTEYTVSNIHSYINRDTEPDCPEEMVGVKYPYSIVLTIVLVERDSK